MLEIDVRHSNGTPWLAVRGELDLSEASRLEQELAAVERNGPKTLVIDLRGLSFIDSSGLRVILEADVRARHDGRRLVLVPGPEQVHRIFLIALLDKRLEFLEDPDASGAEPPGEPGVADR